MDHEDVEWKYQYVDVGLMMPKKITWGANYEHGNFGDNLN